MRAMMLTAIRQMRLMDVPEPHLETDSDVRLRVDTVGVCGSDVHYFTRGRIGSQVVQYPYRVGHEFAGTVLEAGRAATHLKPGDRVAVDPAMSCGTCDQCRAGRPHTCRHLRFLGCPGQAHGCLADQIVMPAECCFPIKPETTLEQAALAEPLSIGVYAVRASIPMPGARIGILGCGPIGLSVLLAAQTAGAQAVYATDPIPARRAAARRTGASWVGTPAEADAAIPAAEPLLLDVVFECCGRQEALDQALTLLKPGGTLMVVGIPETDRVSFSIDALRRQEITVRNVRRQNACMQAALDLIEQRRIDAAPLVTHRFALEQSQEAFDLVADYRDGVVKAMIHVHT